MTVDHLIYVCHVLYMRQITEIPKGTHGTNWLKKNFENWFALHLYALTCRKKIRVRSNILDKLAA